MKTGNNKIIYINKKNNIYDVLEKIKEDKNKKIILSFSFGHPILYNKFLLKTIKKFREEKKIIIYTNDILSKKLIKNVGLKVNLIENNNLLKLNYSFIEYLLYELKKLKKLFLKDNDFSDPRNKFLKYYKQKSNIHIFLFILTISIVIFSYVFLFILNKTFIYISPNIEVREKNLNFVFKQNNILNQKDIFAKKINKHIKIEKIINTSGVEQSDRYRAHGEAILINKFPQDIRLLAHTRLQSQNGTLYEITNSITIPKATKNKLNTVIPGRKKVNIIAKIRNIKGEIIGEKANIPKDINLILPGLSNEEQKKLFAKTTTKIHGGKNVFQKFLSKNDLENAKLLLKEELEKKAIESLQLEINELNKINNSNNKIIDIKDIYDFSNLEISKIKYKIGDKIDSFKISGEIDVSSYMFDTAKVLSILRQEIYEHIIKDKETLINIDQDSLNILPKVGIIKRNRNPFRLKLSIGVNYYVKYNFAKQKDNYINRLKQEIAGLNKEIAIKKLINEDRISNVSIQIRPFFINTISKYLSNIKFEIKD